MVGKVGLMSFSVVATRIIRMSLQRYQYINVINFVEKESTNVTKVRLAAKSVEVNLTIVVI